MSDEDLAVFLCPDDVPTGIRIVAAMSAPKRAAYERMHDLCAEIDLWQAGVGPRPSGVILCAPKQIRRAGRDH